MTTKYQILSHIPDKYKPKMVLLSKIKDLQTLRYPLIAKPSLCSSNARGVSIIKNPQELTQYEQQHGDPSDIIIQEFIPNSREVGILYERNPLFRNGRIINIVERPVPSSNIITGGEGIDRFNWKTPALEQAIDKISKQIPNFYAGRYDIRFYDENDLKQGKNFYIVEANGSFGFDLKHRSNGGFLNYLYGQCRWFVARLGYGLINIVTGKGGSAIMISCYQRFYNCPSMAY